MLIHLCSQWSIDYASNIDYLSAVIEQVDTNLIAEIDLIGSDVLYTEDRWLTSRSIDSVSFPEHAKTCNDDVFLFVIY